jgi:hypothetical protein
LSNHSAAFPDGYLSSDGLRSLYGVAPGPDGQLQYNRGTERIPPNWFRRPFADPYIDPTHGLPDLIYMWTKYPETLIIGGNTNGTDTFAPIDISNLTNGVYSTELLLVGSNAACFLFQFLQIALPGILTNIEAIAAGLLAQVAAQLGLPLLSPACPVLEGMKLELLEKFPGYMKSRKP